MPVSGITCLLSLVVIRKSGFRRMSGAPSGNCWWNRRRASVLLQLFCKSRSAVLGLASPSLADRNHFGWRSLLVEPVFAWSETWLGMLFTMGEGGRLITSGAVAGLASSLKCFECTWLVMDEWYKWGWARAKACTSEYSPLGLIKLCCRYPSLNLGPVVRSNSSPLTKQFPCVFLMDFSRASSSPSSSLSVSHSSVPFPTITFFVFFVLFLISVRRPSSGSGESNSFLKCSFCTKKGMTVRGEEQS